MKTFNNWFNNKFGWFFTNGRKQENKYAHQTMDEVNHVKEALNHAKEEGLQAEVVAWSLMFMKANPSLSVSEAITLGYFEWIK